MENTTSAVALAAPSAALANLGRMAGAVGLVLLFSSPFTWLLTAEVGALVWGKVCVSVVLMAFYLLTNRRFFAHLAGSRSTGLLFLSGLTVGLFIAVTAAVNYAAYTHPWEKDFTRESLYTFSDQTQQVLKGLKTDVHIYAFYASDEQAYPLVEETLSRYHRVGQRLLYDMIDPQARPDLVARYQITDRGPRLVVCAHDQDARAKDVSEQEIVNAVVKVAEHTAKRVYSLTGHGELDMTNGEAAEGGKQFVDAIAAEGYQTAALDLRQSGAAGMGTQAVAYELQTPASDQALKPRQTPDASGLQIPEDAAMVLALGPTHPLLQPEIAALETYLNAGGRLMVFVEPHLKTGLEPLLLQWRIAVHDDLIVDTSPLNRLLGLGAAAPMIQAVQGDHPIVQKLDSAMVMSTVRSLEATSGGLGGVEVTPLAHTTETAWGETQVSKDGSAQKDAKDNLPPLFVAAAAQRHTADAAGATEEGGHRSNTARLVVYGDADWVSNKYLGMQGNRDFALNGINWLAEREDKISIRPKSRAASQLYLSGNQMNQIKFLSMDILPVLIVAAGLGVTLMRRQR